VAMSQPFDVTTLLQQWRGGNEAALRHLIPLVHDELRRIARRHMRGQPGGHTLQASALVNEAYLRLVNVQYDRWQDRAHFLATASRLDATRARRHRSVEAISEARRSARVMRASRSKAEKEGLE
jgi:hypothetical protein